MTETSHPLPLSWFGAHPPTMPVPELQILTSPLGGSALARAAIRGDSQVSGWYAPLPADVDGWRERAHAAMSRLGSGWLERLEPAFDATGEAAANLRRVAQQGGVLVTTGQQPGLFGGPAYAWVKAMSAAALALELESMLGIPVAPVFWAATDDTDFAEASDTWIATPSGAEHLVLPPTATPGRMLEHTELPPEMDALRSRLRAACGSCVDDVPLRVVDEAWQEGRTIGDAYVRQLRALLEPLGMAVLNATHPAVRVSMDAVVRRALREAPAADAAISERCSDIEEQGFTPQVSPVPGLSLVFEDSPDGKARIPIADADSRAANASTGSLGPNVLLRPVAEQAILPTIAYVAGPGELSYFAEVSAVARAIGEPVPLALPRHSITIVEPHVRRTLERLGLAPDDFLDAHYPERKLAREAVPAEVTAKVAELRAAVDGAMTALERLSEGGTDSALPPPAVFRGAASQMEHRIARLERRVAAAAARADEKGQRDLAMLRGALTPGGMRQERALNLVPLFARHGRGLLTAIREAAAPHARALLSGSGVTGGV